MKKQRKAASAKKDGAVTAKPVDSPQTLETSFAEVVALIQQARQNAFQAVNTELIDLYWQVGEYISRKLETAIWGEGVVNQLAHCIVQTHPDIKGFTRASLFRIRQFYETYRDDEKVAPLVRQLSWTHRLAIRVWQASEQLWKAFHNRSNDCHGPYTERMTATAPESRIDHYATLTV